MSDENSPQSEVYLFIDSYQGLTAETAIYPQEKALEYLALGLASEAGEVCGKLKKVIRDGDGTLTDEMKTQLKDELGDVLWYIARLASELDVPLSILASNNLDKLFDRKARGVIGGNGDER